MLGWRDQKEHAVVILGFTELPKTEELVGVSLHVTALQRFDCGYNKLNAGFVLEIPELCFNVATCSGGHDAGLIDHPAAQRGKIEGQRDRRQEKEERQRQGGSPRQAVIIAESKAQRRSGLHVRMSAMPRPQAEALRTSLSAAFQNLRWR